MTPDQSWSQAIAILSEPSEPWGAMATVLSWTRTPVTAGEPERFWLMTMIPSAFQATVLLATSVVPELLTTMPPPQPQAVKPQPFSQTLFPVIVPPELIS